MPFFKKLMAFLNKYPIPAAYRSSVAGAAALMLVMSSLAMRLPEQVVSPGSRSSQDQDALASSDPSIPDVSTPGATGTALPSTGGTVAGPKITKSSNPPIKKGGVDVVIDDSGVPVADLFPAAQDRIGITNNSIKICGHAAVSLGAAFNTTKDDLSIYWSWLQDNGGVHGRDVEVIWEDDAYTPQGAHVAYTNCVAQNPFIMLGGIGFDQIPQVRSDVEGNMLYIHHVATQDLSKKYSFSFLPTVEKMGEMFGEWVIKHHAGEKVGIVWRDGEFWNPGKESFLRTVQGKVNIVVNAPVAKNQGVFTKEIRDLQLAGATTVFDWDNALMATDIIKQARDQDYHPTWLVFPFNTTTDTLDEDPEDPPWEGIAAWSAYAPGPHTGMYAEEKNKFDAAMRQYRPGTPPNDILWQVWLGSKQLHQLFVDCGKDCTRNKVAGLLLTGKHKAISPGCPFDFTRNSHVAGYTVNAFQSFLQSNGKRGWREVESCKEHF